MPIVKETSARLVKFGYNYTVLPQQVLQSIPDPVALAYWAYLLSMPDDWVVRRGQLMAHFGVGRDRHDKAMALLKELGLCWIQVERDEKGRLVDRKIMIGSTPVDDLPKVGKPTMRENPQVGKTDHLQIEPVITNRTTTTTTTKRMIIPSVDEVKDHCITKGYTFDPEAFHAYYSANGWKVGKNPMRDWKQACITWQSKERKNGKSDRRTEKQRRDDGLREAVFSDNW